MTHGEYPPCGECDHWKAGHCTIDGAHDKIGKRDTAFCGGWKERPHPIPEPKPEGRN